MLLTKNVLMKWSYSNKKWYENKGYTFTKWKDEFEVKVEDLPDGSNALIDIQCDGCEKIVTNFRWVDYKKQVKDDDKYYCKSCAMKLYGGENIRLARLKNSKSFEQWCIENNRQDILDRWDYKLNKHKPNEINYSTNKKYYFKCLRGIHDSELKSIVNFTINNQEGSINCNQCNSLAQWGIDKYGGDFLQKYWDYDKNLNINPWKISYRNNRKIWVRCQVKDYHGSYKVTIYNFYDNKRCPFCNSNSGKVHKLDSVGAIYPKVLNVWSNKNKTSPYEYSPHSDKEVYWKCEERIHNDYKRNIDCSLRYNFHCPECRYSKGEKIISEYLMRNNIFYIPQKEFKGLIGLGGGLLSYDFYIPKYNLLIEYQGEFHDGSVSNQTKEEFDKQLEHDRRKKEYALNNGYDFLEIWYYDFENIEKILSETIKTACLMNIK